MMNLILDIAIILASYATVWFIISIIVKRNDIADVAWGIGYILICLYLFMTEPGHPIAWLCYSLVTIWALRLSSYIYFRNRQKTEDFRYKNWREEWGSTFYVRSFFQVYLLQAFFLLIIISPVIFAANQSVSKFTVWSYLGIVVWVIGFVWQALGDSQLARFKKNKTGSNEILNTGLWKYSRHPNYFGEIVMWWGIYLIVWPLPYSYYFIIGPITITFLIRYVSGVPMLEERYKNNAAYQAYKQKVPVLFPKFW